jgi:hypothetical protein
MSFKKKKQCYITSRSDTTPPTDARKHNWTPPPPGRGAELLHHGRITPKQHTHDRRSLRSNFASEENSHHSANENH